MSHSTLEVPSSSESAPRRSTSQKNFEFLVLSEIFFFEGFVGWNEEFLGLSHSKTDMRMIDAVIFMMLVLVVQCNKRISNGMDENVLVKMEIEREIALLRFAHYRISHTSNRRRIFI